MLRNIIWVAFFGLIVGGCASDSNMDSSRGSSSTTGNAEMSRPTTSQGTSASSPRMSEAEAAGSSSMMATTPTDSGVTLRSKQSQDRIAAGIDEETLDTCLGRIPKDATAGQRMLAEQTCQRDFPKRR